MSTCPKPCKSCPWRRDSRAGAVAGPDGPGLAEGHTWTGMMAQAHGPFWLPCHSNMDPSAELLEQDPSKVIPCVGAGIYRTHTHHPMQWESPLTPHYPPSPELVFTSPIEFLAHHMKRSLAAAAVEFYRVPLGMRVAEEQSKVQVKQLLRLR